ncbi:beta-galactosidase [Caldibacillus debilis]|uniref:Beta-galactosidase n=1 Tax=Caldibacillus debilis TaxID=301148 RepID=A0A150LSI6_9BACI|nr:beta-galactosidase [Caldibacillus debilis]KYD15151.1 Beta-galactosidase [Caldibacillus debilis]
MVRKTYVTDAKYFLHGGDYNPDQWLDRKDILADDLKFMKMTRTNTFSVGIFSWSMLEPEEGVYNFEWLDEIFDNIYKNGGRIILATPSGARPAWMSQKYPEILRVNEYRMKQLHGGRHNHCFTSKIYREKTQNINRLLAERYGKHPALLMWHVSNEYSGECHCENCQNAFREWLKKKYNNDLKALNDAWWTAFWSHTYTDWSQIESPSPIGENSIHGLKLDWKRFVTDQTISFFENEIVPLREITPHIPITTNFMADTYDLIPFQGLDYSKFAKHVDVVSWDAYPAWHNDWETTADLAMKVGFINDLYRSLKQQPFILMESTPSGVNWQNVNKAKRPGMHILSSLQMIAHGSDSVMYFQWRKSRGSAEKFHGAVVDHDNRSDNRVFKEVAKLGEILEKIGKITGSNRQSEVGILYDWENNWALNDAQGFAMETKRYPQTLQEHYRFFWERDIPVDVITKEKDFSRYKLLIVPMLYLASGETLGKLKEYVKNGGTLVMTYLSGLVDENDLVYLGGWPKELQEVFGITPLEIDTYYPKDKNSVTYENKTFVVKDYATVIENRSAAVLGEYLEDFYAHTPAITVHPFGKGKAYFLGARLEAAFHQAFYGNLTEELGIKPPVTVRHGKGVSVQVRRDEAHEYVFVMNFTEEKQPVAFETELKDLLTGETLYGETVLEKYEVKIAERSLSSR